MSEIAALHTPKETAARLKLGERTVRRDPAPRNLPAPRHARQQRIPDAALTPLAASASSRDPQLTSSNGRAGPSPRTGTTTATRSTTTGDIRMMLQKGYVVRVPHPFTELDGARTLPAIVVSVPRFARATATPRRSRTGGAR